MEIEQWEEKIMRLRKTKDEFFAEEWQSPIPPENRSQFAGLVYYPLNPDYVFILDLLEHSEQNTIQIEDTGGDIRNMLRWGEFKFNVGGEECVLHIYKSAPNEKRLFIPFRDSTSGKETYGAGRYLDLDPEEDRTSEGKWILDFNKAYNPWCAYSKNYSCPLVPPENWLKVPILAGEKSYPSHDHNDGTE